MSLDKQLELELAIVEFLGLGSTLDILEINEQTYRWEVILEDGTRRIINKGALNNDH
ncbi:MAG: hypothetical protein ACRDBG_08200 [Waterburya sp.]